MKSLPGRGTRRRRSVVVELLVGTGLRLGEALGLQWESVDLSRRTIHVARSWDRSADP
ncbi:tyrosine-type recombinase/integrase [Rhodococcus hoagii]|uniref:Tyrosine-type recombinase/integrase n=1 Tax=Rhodococcus hoagii TaxID=43767 RepID=A0AAE3BCC0_RHOHA|nr:tyrosine-type recombinase/integrase [Prescottella equi]